MKKFLGTLFGLALLGCGAASLNYSKPSTLDAHREWALAESMPEPTDTMFWIGAACAVVGLAVLMLTFRPGRARSSPE